MVVDTSGLIRDSVVRQVVKRVTTTRTEARLDQDPKIEVRLPWRAPVSGCGFVENEPRFIMVGLLLSPDSTALAHATIRVAWADSTRTATSETSIDTRSDGQGYFRVCGVPGGRDLAVEVTLPSGEDYHGKSSVPLVVYDESGRKRNQLKERHARCNAKTETAAELKTSRTRNRRSQLPCGAARPCGVLVYSRCSLMRFGPLRLGRVGGSPNTRH